MTEKWGMEWVVIDKLPEEGDPNTVYIVPTDCDGNPSPYGFTAWIYVDKKPSFVTEIKEDENEEL